MKYKIKIDIDDYNTVYNMIGYCQQTFGPNKIKGKKRNRNVWAVTGKYASKSYAEASFRNEQYAMLFAMRWS